MKGFRKVSCSFSLPALNIIRFKGKNPDENGSHNICKIFILLKLAKREPSRHCQFLTADLAFA